MPEGMVGGRSLIPFQAMPKIPTRMRKPFIELDILFIHLSSFGGDLIFPADRASFIDSAEAVAVKYVRPEDRPWTGLEDCGLPFVLGSCERSIAYIGCFIYLFLQELLPAQHLSRHYLTSRGDCLHKTPMLGKCYTSLICQGGVRRERSSGTGKHLCNVEIILAVIAA